MKKRIFAVAMALCLMAGTSAFAQDAKKAPMPEQKWTVEQIAQKKTDKMTEALKLNEQQSKQLYDYNLSQIKDMQSKRAQMHADRKAEAEKMKSLLTPEQYAQWQQMDGPMYGKKGMKGKKCKDGMMSKDGKCCKEGKDCKDGKGQMNHGKK